MVRLELDESQLAPLAIRFSGWLMGSFFGCSADEGWENLAAHHRWVDDAAHAAEWRIGTDPKRRLHKRPLRISIGSRGTSFPRIERPRVRVALRYGKVTEADVNEIVEQHIIGGRPVERLLIAW